MGVSRIGRGVSQLVLNVAKLHANASRIVPNTKATGRFPDGISISATCKFSVRALLFMLSGMWL